MSQRKEIDGLIHEDGFAQADPDKLPQSIVKVDAPGRKYKVHADLVDDLIEIDKLLPWNRNPRNGDVERIAHLMDTHGQWKPIGVNFGTYTRRIEPHVIGFGNHTYAAAMSLGWTHIAKTWLDVGDDQFEEIAIADNASADAAWNDKALLLEVAEDIDYRRAGLTDDDMQDLRISQEDDEEEAPPPEDDEGEDQSGDLGEGYEIIVTLQTEEEQGALLEYLTGEGYQCRALL